ncbi:hypothetical protein F2Q68_00011324 [Brassica cretica]|uniref:Uncharacterized protein n=1 Tax=Brassica cretica TaxID=69181 RepID=A0A8S9KXH8_BRACR|nr:hypothetical protein F2Q68_00011324 [Brassica cretica]
MVLSSGSKRWRVARRHHFGVVNRRSGTRNRHAVVLYISAPAVAYMPFRCPELFRFFWLRSEAFGPSVMDRDKLCTFWC